MKKWVLFFAMALLMTATAFSAPNVTITQVTNLTSPLLESSCSAGNGLIYCMCGQLGNDLFIFDPSTNNLTTQVVNEPQCNPGDNMDCQFYEPLNSLICSMYSNNYLVNLTDYSIVNLSRIEYTTFTPMATCDLRPGTDEIYCWNRDMVKYDIGSDTMTYVGEFYNLYDWGRGIGCGFKNSDEFWCYGGYSDLSNEVMKYDVSANTSTWFTMGTGMADHFCRVVGDYLVCYGGDDMDYPLDTIYFFDTVTNESGALNTTLPYTLTTWEECAVYNETTDYCLGGYTGEDWDESPTVLRLDWVLPAPPCTPSWNCTGYDACQEDDFQYCNSTVDLNVCGEEYAGNYSEFEPVACDYCTPDWNCTSFDECILDTEECLAVGDLNICGELFEGNLSDYDESCTVIPPITGYVSQYGTFDFKNMVIDLLGNAGSEFVVWVGLLVMVGVAGLAVSRLKRLRMK